MKVLVASANQKLLTQTSQALKEEEFTLINVANGAEALQVWQREQPDIVLVNDALPSVNGFDVCQKIRQESQTPVIILTTTRSEHEVTQGFACGADDVVTGSVPFYYLPMKIRSIVQRYAAIRAAKAAKPKQSSVAPQTLLVDGLTLDLDLHQLRCGGLVSQLTPREFRLLRVLALSPGVVVSVGRLVEAGWGQPDVTRVNRDTLAFHVIQIRRKLRAVAADATIVGTRRSQGYALSRL